MNMDFYGNKLLLCKTKEEFDNLTLEQMEGYDAAFCLNRDDYTFYISDLCNDKIRRIAIETNFSYKNKDLSLASLCLNACFSFLKTLYERDLLGVYIKEGHIQEKKFSIVDNKIKIKHRLCDNITSLPHATLYDVGNQHWVCEKGNIHNIPKDKSVNIHEYYDVVENEENVECTVDFFERGVGETKSCGSGALCVGMHLFGKYNKTVIVKTTSGDKYFVDKEGISVEM
jgi:diaminopimelate epimerase